MKQSSFSRFFLSVFALIVTAILLPGAAIAQNTTSSMRIVTTDTEGGAAGGVPVNIRHVPTGRLQSMTSNSDGIVIAPGLAVGGPYEVAVGGEFAADILQGIYLELDKTEVVTLVVRSAIEEVIVTASAPTEKVVVGVGRAFDRASIDATPSISRDFVSTLARDPKILVDNSVARGPAISMAGQNFRFNSVTIDGIAQSDNFGLNKNASATSRTPISIDAVEAINVNMAPYDVSYGNFIGGNINIVTKSGTNEFHGSAFYYSTDDSFSGDKSDGVNIDIGNFEEDTYGFTLGGPIIKDQLFFFVNYEKFETTVPANAQPLSAIPGVTQADVDNVTNILNTEYGFDPGLFATTDVDEDEKVLLKVDWYINDDHRAVGSYQTADTDVLFDDFPTAAALNSNRYNINQELTAISAQLFSNWTEQFSTEIKIGKKEVIRRDRSVDSSTNEFLILTPQFGTILAGGDRFRHSNELDNDSTVFRIKGDYAIGDHLITAGWERESKDVRNRFLPFSKGLFVFDIAGLGDGDPSTVADRVPLDVVYGNSNTGIATDAEANFTLDVDSFYVQDEWTPTDDLTLTYGIRYDTYTNDDPITDNPNFLARRGFSNGENLDGKDLLLPRFGFNWTASDRLTVRGGAGLFGGGSPLIILSNSYAGDGISRTFARPGFTFPQAALDAAVAALPSPDAAFDALQPFLGVDPNASTDVIDPGYDILSTWKYSLGADYLADLSRFGMGDEWSLSADIVFSDVKDGYDIYEARRTVIDTAPDGRPIYDTPGFGFESDFVVTNSGIGSGTVLTLGLAKTFETNAGLFDLTFGYTHQDIDELRSYNRFITFETHVFDTGTDMNNPVEAPSRYETENRVTATLGWQKELFGDNMSSIGLVYAGRTGRHYSYVFGSNGVCTFGGSGLADCGAETDIAGSQLFYVPTGPSDPLISGDPAFLADLDEYIGLDGCLSGSRGSIVTRNNCETDWTNIFSVRFMQEIKVGDVGFDVMLDIENVGNLLNSDWGRVESYTAPSVVAPANVSIPVAGGPYLLTPTSSYDASVGATSIISPPEIAALPSVYRIQLGFRVRF
ncbi:MAG: TonB-dependent receptor [Gammaproteobacteria bacterium]|nr:TonB-dependent receptor [Gammaproteobacteria bacterium]MBT8111709.1 TonB-dependent receptor [Gammaproteobacteria bacterium]NND47607.1 TonB-dependent receptor [Woeseiaceae bacterium]NNL46407.1 TonB-dependent receptor [Woeseiaceae bacterium]